MKLSELMLESGKIFCCVYLYNLFWSKLNRQEKQTKGFPKFPGSQKFGGNFMPENADTLFQKLLLLCVCSLKLKFPSVAHFCYL